MPWDGSQNYQYPPGTPGIPDQTIESVKYNTFLDDLLVNDLNVPRPIHRGGTAGNTALQALQNLGGEKAQQVVTNYDSMTWLSGSFYSAAGATSAPVAGHRFVGMVSVQDANNIAVQAYDLDSTPAGKLYQRVKKDGAWGSFVSPVDTAAADFVNVTGDTMTGGLAIMNGGLNIQNGVFTVDTPNVIHAVGSQTNSGYGLLRIRATGGVNSAPVLSLFRSTVLEAAFSVQGLAVYLSTAPVSHLDADLIAAGKFQFNHSGTFRALVNVTSTSVSTGSIVSNGGLGVAGAIYCNTVNSAPSTSNVLGDVRAARGANDGALYYGVSGPAFLGFNGTLFTFSGGHVNFSHGATFPLTVTANVFDAQDAPNAFKIAGSTVLRRSGVYTTINSPTLSGGLLLGSGSDKANYYDNDIHYFRTAAAATYFTINNVASTVTSVFPIHCNNIVYATSFKGIAAGPVVVNGDAAVINDGNWHVVLAAAVAGGQNGYFQIIHVPGVYSASRIGHTSYAFDFRNDGMAYKASAGDWAAISDARIKEVQGSYTHGLNEIINLNPVVFRFKGNVSYAAPKEKRDGEEIPDSDPSLPIHRGTALETDYVGLVAQEVEPHLPETIKLKKGYIDNVAVDDLREFDPTAITYALVNAVKTLHQRVAALEGA